MNTQTREVGQLEILATQGLITCALEVDQLEIRREVDHIECRQAYLASSEKDSAEADQLDKFGRWLPANYKPDVKQKRVRDRIKNSLARFLYAYRGREMQLHRDRLEESFGSHGNRMYFWLKSRLLVNVRGHSAEAGRATTYIVNQDGFDNLWKLVHREAFNFAEQRAKQLAPELQPYFDGSKVLPLHSTVEGGRLYGPHLKMERDVKAILLAGCWDYDIQVAMPTLVLQSVPGWQQKYPFWHRYLGNRKHYRQQLAQEYGCTSEQAKEVFQFLFSGATFNGSRHGVGKVLNHQQLKKAMSDPWLWGLYKQAQDMWCSLGLRSSRGPERFRYYEAIEQSVMQILYSRLNQKGIRFWPFHDGFTVISGERPDVHELRAAVREKTGFMIMLEEKQL